MKKISLALALAAALFHATAWAAADPTVTFEWETNRYTVEIPGSTADWDGLLALPAVGVSPTVYPLQILQALSDDSGAEKVLTKITASGPLNEAAWACVASLLGTYSTPTVSTDITTTAIIPSALVSSGDFDSMSWDDCWTNLATQTGITLNVTLEGVAGDAGNTNTLASIFANEGITVTELTLTGTSSLQLPAAGFTADAINLGPSSTLDVSVVTDLTTLPIPQVESGATLVLASGDVTEIAEKLMEWFGANNVPSGIVIEDDNGALMTDEVLEELDALYPSLTVDDVVFDSLPEPYNQPDAKPVTITNDGGSLATITDVVLSSGAEFTLITGGSLPLTVASGDSDTSWKVRPEANLPVGSYSDTITVTYDGGATAAADVSFEVLDALSPSLAVDNVVFGSLQEPYAQPDAKSVTITNSGGAQATITSVALSNNTAFTLTDTGVSAVVPIGGSNTSWTARPKADLSVAQYTDTITVTYDGGATATATVSFEVTGQTPPPPPPDDEKKDFGGGGCDSGFFGLTSFLLALFLVGRKR
jgi:hypothetical protein